jgi:hypothetical protein
MPATKLVWEKFPSVTTGGKPFFWVGRKITTRYARKVATVFWSRVEQQWAAEDGDEKRLGLFFTADLAKACVEDKFPGEWSEGLNFYDTKTEVAQGKRRAK